MNKKILMLTIMLLAMLTLTIIPVQAAPKTEQTFTLYIEGLVTDWGVGSHAGPRGTEADNPEPKDLIQRTFHTKATVFEISYAELNIEGEDPLILDLVNEVYDFDISEEHSVNFNWATMIGASKPKDTITFYEPDGTTVWGTLEISVREKVNYATIPPSSEGIIFGKGTGALKGAKIEGTTTGIQIPLGDPAGDPLPIITMLTRVGTISGWTPPPPPSP